MRHRMKSIALVSAGLKRRGAERIVLDLAQGMKSGGLDVRVFSIQGGDLHNELKEVGIPVKVLAGRASEYRASYGLSFKMTLRLAYLLYINRIQAINIHGLGPERIALLASKLSRTPVRTFVFHSNYPALTSEHSSDKFVKRLRRTLAQTSHCIAISSTIMETLLASQVIEANRISVITNGVDINKVRSTIPKAEMRQKLGLRPEDTVLIQVGRFHPLKNHDISVKALSLIKDKYPNISLLFVGDGAEFDRIKKLARETGVFSRIRFLGLRADVHNLLGAADLFLLPSSWEGIPISLLEAFANGIPAICTNVVGISDVVDLDPSTAKLIEPRNEKALAGAISEALDNPDWISEARMASLKLVNRHFKSDRMVQQYISLHESLFSKLTLA